MTSKTIQKAFSYCPICQSNKLEFDQIKKYTCTACGWEFYQNTAAAVACIVEKNGKVLVVERNREPGKGMFDFPGGFVDPDETAEEAALRELKEELGIEPENLRYLGSAPNHYVYKGIEYTTCDLFFVCELKQPNLSLDISEIASVHWLSAEDLDGEKFAFESMRKALVLYRNQAI
ncbi:MAG: NUDIX domain-containing protein [Bacteroidota bacterium]|nr:MAG: NUDIX domain-containing protein [Bacteroidota bacterium]